MHRRAHRRMHVFFCLVLPDPSYHVTHLIFLYGLYAYGGRTIHTHIDARMCSCVSSLPGPSYHITHLIFLYVLYAYGGWTVRQGLISSSMYFLSSSYVRNINSRSYSGAEQSALINVILKPQTDRKWLVPGDFNLIYI